MVESMTRYRFSGHNTFTFRYGWLEKGVRLIAADPKGFNADDVLIRLGVGKNMVPSIRYWCTQAQLLQDDSAGGLHLTPLASFIFGMDGSCGCDPFMEDDSTLWLLHWLLSANDASLSSMQIIMSQYLKPDFTKDELLNYLKKYLRDEIKISDDTFKRDIDCFVRTYCAANYGNAIKEDSFDCPFHTLGLIQPTSESDLYRFIIGPKRSLPTHVLGFAVFQYLQRHSNRRSWLVRDCLYEPFSPGQIFKLDENSLVLMLEEVSRLTQDAIVVNDTAGLLQILLTDQHDGVLRHWQMQLLEEYYHQEGVLQ